jgi:hypothetical protein
MQANTFSPSMQDGRRVMSLIGLASCWSNDRTDN